MNKSFPVYRGGRGVEGGLTFHQGHPSPPPPPPTTTLEVDKYCWEMLWQLNIWIDIYHQ